MKFFKRISSSHALLANLIEYGVDRVFLVPGESYLGVLDALNDFPLLDVVTCRHEAGAGFMAVADGRLARRAGVVMVSRGPGATNASIAVHTAQQDAVPLILIIGQVPVGSLGREAFQEIDYQKMFGGIAKWVAEPTSPEQLAGVAAKAMQLAVSGTPGPVVIVLPEDIQQQEVPVALYTQPSTIIGAPTVEAVAQLKAMLRQAKRPLIVAGGSFDLQGGREALRAFAESWNVPVAVSFRRHDLFPNDHPLYAGDLGLSNPAPQMQAFHDCDLLMALGTRFGDITSQGYNFPLMPRPSQTVVHCFQEYSAIGRQFVVDLGIVCNPVLLVRQALPESATPATRHAGWTRRLRSIYEEIARWPVPGKGNADGITVTEMAQVLADKAPSGTLVCLDAGTFGAPFYRHFPFGRSHRLLAPISGAMGYGVPAAVAAQLREPDTRVVCVVGDGGFMMTGNEMIAAVSRRLPILFLLSNNDQYGSIRLHQDNQYPGRHAGTSLFNPDFLELARAFGVASERVTTFDQLAPAFARGLAVKDGPYFLEVRTKLPVVAAAHVAALEVCTDSKQVTRYEAND